MILGNTINRIRCLFTKESEGVAGVKDDSKLFGQSNWKAGVGMRAG